MVKSISVLAIITGNKLFLGSWEFPANDHYSGHIVGLSLRISDPLKNIYDISVTWSSFFCCKTATMVK